MTHTVDAIRPATAAAAAAPLLSVNNIEVVYDDVILVLRGLSLEVPKGAIVALLGANGAGKSTTLKAISGLLKTEDGEVIRGEIVFDTAKPDGMYRKLLDVSRLHALGWRAKIPLVEGLKTAYADFLAGGGRDVSQSEPRRQGAGARRAL